MSKNVATFIPTWLQSVAEFGYCHRFITNHKSLNTRMNCIISWPGLRIGHQTTGDSIARRDVALIDESQGHCEPTEAMNLPSCCS
jgi:hypothetical protein